MSQFGHVSAVNLSGQYNMPNVFTGKMNGLNFAVSDAMGHKLRVPDVQAFGTRSYRNALPLKVCLSGLKYVLDFNLRKTSTNDMFVK